MEKFETTLVNIKAEANLLIEKSDEELNDQIEKIKKKLKIEKNLDSITPEWYALVQELSFRHLKLRHFDMQLFAGLVLLDGNVIEMKTGEGKTLTSTLPISLKALEKKGAHVITVNEYLAERDEKLMGKLYQRLGLSSALIKHTSSLIEKQKNYASDITYITNSEVVFDYLKDCTAYNENEIVQRPLHYCIIDEIDSILIDEANTPLVLSTPGVKGNKEKLMKAKGIIKLLKKNIDYILDEKQKNIFLTEEGYDKLEIIFLKKKAIFKTTKLYEFDNPWINYILNALRAQEFYLLNRDYIILNKKINIVDEFTGRVMGDRRWTDGLHEAIEAKENLPIEEKNESRLAITYQSFFPLYSSFSGMSGTAVNIRKELERLYKIGVYDIPTVKPMIRKDFPDKVYRTKREKWNAIVNESIESYKKGQPILIGTTSVENSEFLSQLFNTSGIPHQVLNAKPENLKRENEIIARAGELGAVTIATNMAGRGTDIILGGNINFRIKEHFFNFLLKKQNETFSLASKDFFDKKEEEFFLKIQKEYAKKMTKFRSDIENLPYSLENAENALKEWYSFLFLIEKKKWEKDNIKVKEVGGLKVLGTERHSSRRIDDQLRGRSGRQGDPGISQFFIALDDPLLAIFGTKRLQFFFDALDELVYGQPLEAKFLSKSIEQAQEKIESLSFETRQNMLDYEMVINKQFQIFFNCRKELLFKKNLSTILLRYKEQFVDTSFFSNFFLKKFLRFFTFSKFRRRIKKFISTIIPKKYRYFQKSKISKIYPKDAIITKFLGPYWKKIVKKKNSSFQHIWNSHDLQFHSVDFDQNSQSQNLRFPLSFYLDILDTLWIKHVERLSYIRETNNLKTYGQQNPLNEYIASSYSLFLELLNEIQFAFLTEDVFRYENNVSSKENNDLLEEDNDSLDIFSS